MTKDQAIKELRICECYSIEPSVEALDMAIKALEQQPSDDCVSRQAVLDKKVLIELSDGQSFYSIDPEDVKALPPVTPTHCIAAVRFSKEDLREICNERIEIECTHGTCKDCKSECTESNGEKFSESRPTFYCADFEKRGSENG